MRYNLRSHRAIPAAPAIVPYQAAKVLAIPELLEAILLQLPPHDLLLAQRVTKSFFNAIQASKHIQQKLFFIAPPTSDDECPLLNPFFGRITRVCSGDTCPWLRRLRWVDDLSEPEQDEVSETIGDIRISPFKVRATHVINISTFSKPVDSEIVRHGSFRKMLIATKACKFVIGSLSITYKPDDEITTSNMMEVMNSLIAALTRSMLRKGRDVS